MGRRRQRSLQRVVGGAVNSGNYPPRRVAQRPLGRWLKRGLNHWQGQFVPFPILSERLPPLGRIQINNPHFPAAGPTRAQPLSENIKGQDLLSHSDGTINIGGKCVTNEQETVDDKTVICEESQSI